MKEKLIELLDDIQRDGNSFDDIERYGMRFPDTVSNEDVATHLIANGVTIQNWIPVTERLPEEGVPVLAFRSGYCGPYGDVTLATYRHGYWYGCKGLEMTHWKPILLPLPEPPKEVTCNV